jgi:drug/metabolite transporter (DMT)-like permease
MADRGRRDVIGGLLTATAAVVFGTIVTIGRSEGVRDVPVSSLLAIRFGTAAALLAVLLAITGQPIRPASGEWWRLLMLGAIGYGVEAAFFFLALGRGTAATVTLLFYTYPVWVAVLSAVLGMGLPGLLVGGSLAAAVIGSGVVVASSGGLDITAIGILFAMSSAFMISFFLIGLERLVRRTSPLVSSMWIALAAATGQAVIAVASGARLPVWPEEVVPILAMGGLTDHRTSGHSSAKSAISRQKPVGSAL